MSKHQPARKRLKKSTLAASSLITCCVFICTNSEYSSHRTLYNGRSQPCPFFTPVYGALSSYSCLTLLHPAAVNLSHCQGPEDRCVVQAFILHHVRHASPSTCFLGALCNQGQQGHPFSWLRLQVAKFWHADFFTCTNLQQTLFKPQIYGAGRCQQVRQDLKESSICCARQL